MKWWLVANPASAGGRTGRRLEALRAAATEVLGDVTLRATEGPGHATALAREAVEAGADRVLAVGGDGTANEVVNGLFDGHRPRRADVAFGIVPAGSGGDLVRTLGVPRDPGKALAWLRDRTPSLVDVLACTYQTPTGPENRLAVNVVGFGMEGEVVRLANESSKRLGGTLTFLLATGRAALTYKPPKVRLEWETAGETATGRRTWRGALASAFVANGAYCGGGMWVGRGGTMDDGAADVTLIPDLPRHRMVLGGPRLFLGTFDRVKGVSRLAVRTISAFAEEERRVLVDLDGEQPGFLPVSILVLQKTLLILR